VETPKSEAKAGPGFDQVLAALRAIVDKLEGGQLTLEEALRAFEDGVRLSREGAQILDDAEARIEILTRVDPAAPGGVRTAPFEAGAKPANPAADPGGKPPR
jgi:exodeoxyribonuclease VII small subunit